MDCLKKAFESFTGEVISFGHPAPYHIQEIIASLAKRWHITEFIFDDLAPECPLGHKCPLTTVSAVSINALEVLRRYDGVLTYWTGPDMQHAIVWHKDDTPVNHDFSIFWRVERRIISGG